MTMHQSPRIRRLRSDLAALERLRSESSVFRFRPRAIRRSSTMSFFQGRVCGDDRGKVRILETASGRDQAGGVLSPEHTRDSLADSDLSPQYFRNRHGLPGGIWHALGSQRAARRTLRHALGHGCAITTTIFAARTTANPRSGSPVRPTFLFPTDARPLRDLRAALGRVDARVKTSQRTRRRQRSGRIVPRALVPRHPRTPRRFAGSSSSSNVTGGPFKRWSAATDRGPTDIRSKCYGTNRHPKACARAGQSADRSTSGPHAECARHAMGLASPHSRRPRLIERMPVDSDSRQHVRPSRPAVVDAEQRRCHDSRRERLSRPQTSRTGEDDGYVY